jgi:glutaredoxin-like protein NrdH
MTVTVYSKPSCVQCTATYRGLKNAGVEFTIVDMSVDEDALARVKALGYQQAPVVITDDDNWSGYNPIKIGALKERLQLIAA